MGIRSVDDMIAEARRDLENHSPEVARRRAEDEGAVLVDIRDVRELQREGCIPGSMHAPRGMLEFWVDPGSPYFKPVFGEDHEFVLY